MFDGMQVQLHRCSGCLRFGFAFWTFGAFRKFVSKFGFWFWASLGFSKLKFKINFQNIAMRLKTCCCWQVCVGGLVQPGPQKGFLFSFLPSFLPSFLVFFVSTTASTCKKAQLSCTLCRKVKTSPPPKKIRVCTCHVCFLVCFSFWPQPVLLKAQGKWSLSGESGTSGGQNPSKIP